MRKILIVSPHFPPDTSAGAHRVRLLAPHLKRYGWEPTVVAVDPRDYDSRLDPELASLVPASLHVVRCRAWPTEWTRRIGFGDLGLRALTGLYRTCSLLLRRDNFDALFITIYPAYPALLGSLLKRRFGVPFILDYQDPWVGSWGLTVGGRPDGGPDIKSRLARTAASIAEPRVVRTADAITAVSAETYEQMWLRQCKRPIPCAEIPLGGEPGDFESLRRQPRPTPYFDPFDGNVHVCYVGTLLPLGFETLRAVLEAAALLRQRQPQIYARLRFHFFGTSNQTSPEAPQRVLPVAREIGVEECVSEIAPRIDYMDALAAQTQANVILMMGSSERHYTASKLYPGLFARRPILAVYHSASTVVEILQRAANPPTIRIVVYDDTNRAQTRVEEIYQQLLAVVQSPVYESQAVDLSVLDEYSANSLAGRLVAVLNQVVKN